MQGMFEFAVNGCVTRSQDDLRVWFHFGFFEMRKGSAAHFQSRNSILTVNHGQMSYPSITHIWLAWFIPSPYLMLDKQHLGFPEWSLTLNIFPLFVLVTWSYSARCFPLASKPLSCKGLRVWPGTWRHNTHNWQPVTFHVFRRQLAAYLLSLLPQPMSSYRPQVTA